MFIDISERTRVWGPVDQQPLPGDGNQPERQLSVVRGHRSYPSGCVTERQSCGISTFPVPARAVAQPPVPVLNPRISVISTVLAGMDTDRRRKSVGMHGEDANVNSDVILSDVRVWLLPGNVIQISVWGVHLRDLSAAGT